MWDDNLEQWSSEEMDQDYRTPLDLVLEVAYKFHADAACPKCGVPWWYGRSTHQGVEFEINENICYSCVELEEYKEKHKDDKKKGVTEVVVPVGTQYIDDSDPLPTPLEAMRGH